MEEGNTGQPEPQNTERAPLNPPDEMTRPGVPQRLEEYKQLVNPQDAKADPGIHEKLEELRSREQQAKAEGESPTFVTEDVSLEEIAAGEAGGKPGKQPETPLEKQYGQYSKGLQSAPDTLVSDPLYQMKMDSLQRDLAQATPEEQKEILMLQNKDWRAYLEKHGIDEQPLEEVVALFDMKAKDIRAGIEEGLITDPQALRVYGRTRLSEVRQKTDTDMVGPDTQEQYGQSMQAIREYHAAAEELEPLVSGTPREQATYCADLAQERMKEDSTDEEEAQQRYVAASHWYEMAARVAVRSAKERKQTSGTNATPPEVK